MNQISACISNDKEENEPIYINNAATGKELFKKEYFEDDLIMLTFIFKLLGTWPNYFKASNRLNYLFRYLDSGHKNQEGLEGLFEPTNNGNGNGAPQGPILDLIDFGSFEDQDDDVRRLKLFLKLM